MTASKWARLRATGRLAVLLSVGVGVGACDQPPPDAQGTDGSSSSSGSSQGSTGGENTASPGDEDDLEVGEVAGQEGTGADLHDLSIGVGVPDCDALLGDPAEYPWPVGLRPPESLAGQWFLDFGPSAAETHETARYNVGFELREDGQTRYVIVDDDGQIIDDESTQFENGRWRVGSGLFIHSDFAPYVERFRKSFVTTSVDGDSMYSDFCESGTWVRLDSAGTGLDGRWLQIDGSHDRTWEDGAYHISWATLTHQILEIRGDALTATRSHCQASYDPELDKVVAKPITQKTVRATLVGDANGFEIDISGIDAKDSFNDYEAGRLIDASTLVMWWDPDMVACQRPKQP